MMGDGFWEKERLLADIRSTEGSLRQVASKVAIRYGLDLSTIIKI